MKGWKQADLPGKSTPPAVSPPIPTTEPPQPAPTAHSGKISGLIRWQVATGLHLEQYPQTFRLVLEGDRAELPEFIKYLNQYKPKP